MRAEQVRPLLLLSQLLVVAVLAVRVAPVLLVLPPHILAQMEALGTLPLSQEHL
jgi:hypothetical protein